MTSQCPAQLADSPPWADRLRPDCGRLLQARPAQQTRVNGLLMTMTRILPAAIAALTLAACSGTSAGHVDVP